MECGFVSDGATPEAVATTGFDYPPDTLADQIREAIARDLPLEPIINAALEETAMQLRAEGMDAVLSILLGAANPRLAAAQLAFAGGLHAQIGESGPQIAKRFGITKQAFQQGVEEFRKRLGLRKTRTMRSDEARARMASSNYRQRKPA